jgi:peptide/nickel transport system substrate-binding protein
VPHQRLELVPNTEYWNKARIPKQDRLVLIPMLEASTRTAALLTGEVNWIEAPSPDVYWAPAGSNWGHYESPATEALADEIFNEFDEEKRLQLLTQLHELEGKEAVMIFVVHDLNPRAMSPKVQGFVQAQSWFQDLTPVTVEP